MWPFSSKPASADDPWNGSWVVAHRRAPGRPMYLRCNQSARALIDERRWTVCVSVGIPLRDADHDGLPRGVEAADLLTIEEVLLRHLEDTRRGILVLTISTSGMREFVFYAADSDWAQRALDRAREEISTHEVQSYVEQDPEWRRYQELAG